MAEKPPLGVEKVKARYPQRLDTDPTQIGVPLGVSPLSLSMLLPIDFNAK